MPRPDEGLIHEWLDGELDAAEAARVEALVASDPEWSAAAAEARGLIAATSRIVGALDHVPVQVIPKAAPTRGSNSRWIWRAAAALVLVAGSAVVLQKESPELPVAPLPVAPPAPAAQEKPAALPPKTAAPPVAQPAEKRSNLQSKELDAVKKQTEPSRDKDAALADRNAISSAGSINRPAAPARADAAGAAAAPAPSQRAAALKAEAKVATTVSCFEQRVPADSASRIIRLDAAALEDSVRLERLTIHGDTLAAVHSRLIAVRVRCP